jgi:hypothetical protein
MEIIQIVPNLPPATGGLSDSSLLVAKELRDSHQIHSRFVVGDPAWHGSREIEGFFAEPTPDRTPGGLLKTLGDASQTVLLHYVGYGYATRGCPFWLIDGLTQWRKKRDKWLVTIFHELWAFGPPWRSSFWTHPCQKSLTKRLANATDRCQTSMNMCRKILESIAPRHLGRIPALPVFSTVGEGDTWRHLDERKRQMVVFGGPSLRTKTYSQHSKQLVDACSALQIECILDIGPPIGIKPDLPLPVIVMGKQSAKEICRLLSESMAGFVSYSDAYLAKSSIFAAYCAHGLLPIVARQNRSGLDGIRVGSEYLTALTLSDYIGATEMQAIADRARAWYEKHSLAKTAASLASALRNKSTACNC